MNLFRDYLKESLRDFKNENIRHPLYRRQGAARA